MTLDLVREKLKTVPTPIFDWFGSNEMIEGIIRIKEKFDLSMSDPIIPELLLRLEVKDLPWESFEAELAQKLGILPVKAGEISDEIKISLLIPVARDLAAYGIGTKEFALVATSGAPLPPVGAVNTAPRTASGMPSFFSTVGGRPSSMPPAAPSATSGRVPVAPIAPPAPSSAHAPVPAAPSAAAPAAVPMPVFLHQESQASSVKSDFHMPVDLSNRRGDQFQNAGSTMGVPPPPRTAKIELGHLAPQYDGAPQASVRVEKETSLPNVSFGSMTTDRVVGGVPSQIQEAPNTGPVSFSWSGAVVPATVTAPEDIETAPAAPAEDATMMSEEAARRQSMAAPAAPESIGIVDTLIKKAFPWHYARFAREDTKASAVLESVVPGKVVNYSDAPPAAPQAQQQVSSVPMPSPTPMPTSIDDMLPPAPPKPLA